MLVERWGLINGKLDHVAGGGTARGAAEFAVDGGQVLVHGGGTDGKLRGYLGIGQPLFHQVQYRDLMRRQASRDDVGFLAENEFNSAANLVQFHTEVAQDAGSNTFAFACEGEQEVFGADVMLLKALRFFLSPRDDLADLHSEFVKPLATYLHHALVEGCVRES